MWYGEIGLLLWIVSSLILCFEGIMYFCNKQLGSIRKWTLLGAVVSYIFAWFMFLPFLFVYMQMPHH